MGEEKATPHLSRYYLTYHAATLTRAALCVTTTSHDHNWRSRVNSGT